MKFTKAIIVCGTLMALSLTESAHAENDDIATLTRRLEAMQAELDELKDQQTEYVSYRMSEPAQVCGDACTNSGCCPQAMACCQEPICYAGYELAILKPNISTLRFGPRFDDDYGLGHRFILGREGATGLGVRGRYFFYNQGHDHPGVGRENQQVSDIRAIDIDLDVADLEVTQRERFRSWDLLLSGGVRYARYDQATRGVDTNLDFDIVSNVSEGFEFEGVGPTVAIQANRRVGGRGFYLLGNFRTSLLMGDIDYRFMSRAVFEEELEFSSMEEFDIEDELVVVLENQLGFGWNRSGENADLDLRCVWETQFWLNDTFANYSFGGLGSNLGLSGPTVAAIVSF